MKTNIALTVLIMAIAGALVYTIVRYAPTSLVPQTDESQPVESKLILTPVDQSGLVITPLEGDE